MKTLLGHTTAETAYLVEDYPYGFRLRCKIRYWLEHTKHGFRLVSQTTNPKRPGEIWNKPKASTYASLAGVMYLDDDNHVQWKGLGDYTQANDVAAFVRDFPELDAETRAKLTELCEHHMRLLTKFIEGTAFFTVNGVRRPDRPEDVERRKAELAEWGGAQAVLLAGESQ